ncbi:MAG TPA: hypothetical protein DEQ47_19055 [Solibacterales bacterium]|nr:hypothetical protein [Bryobacterales bacterium]
MKGILIASLLILAGRAGIAAGASVPLHVTVYNKANVPPETTTRAAQTLRFLFAHSDVEIEWVAGNPEADEANFVTYTGIVNKEQERRFACRARRDIALRLLANAPASVPTAVLGFALPFATEGVNVQIYSDHIAKAATSRNVPLPDLLAHAIAHEIGHVLLRSTAHAGNGLMAAVWKEHEYGWLTKGSMFFTTAEAATIRESIEGARCPGTLSTKR